jgi:hypothetical protein
VKEPTKDIAGAGRIVRKVTSRVIMKLILILDLRPALAWSVPASMAAGRKVAAQPGKSLVVGLKEQIATRGFGSLLFWPMRLQRGMAMCASGLRGFLSKGFGFGL